ncbi:MAG: glycerol kinase 5 [Promethearchaeota archaeon]
MSEKQKYICSVDLGSTGVRALLFNKEGNLIASDYTKITPIIPQEGWIEHDPNELWNSTKNVIQKAIQSAKISANQIAAIGITNQRSSFTLWEKDSSKIVCNFINWADIRAAKTAEKANKLLAIRLFRVISKIIYAFSRSQSALQSSIVNFTTDHASIRLKHLFDENPELRNRAKKGDLAFGTIDSWLIYKLTGDKVHVTDYSNASATGLFDAFNMKWHNSIMNLFKIPQEVLPELKDTSGLFGKTDPSIFGAEIPITASVGDQMAALFGQCCFEKGMAKVSHGSGSFVDINVGNKPIVSKKGLYPLVAWKIGDKINYMLEGINALTGTLINWVVDDLGIVSSPQELDKLAESVEDAENLYAVPALNGIRFPYFDSFARGLMIGFSLNTKKAHLCRAILEGIAFRTKDILDVIEYELNIKIPYLCADGGVSNSDPLLQFSADILNKEVHRQKQKEITALGAAFLAGLGIKYWNSLKEIKNVKQVEKVFKPNMKQHIRDEKYKRWLKAVQRSFNWAY